MPNRSCCPTRAAAAHFLAECFVPRNRKLIPSTRLAVLTRGRSVALGFADSSISCIRNWLSRLIKCVLSPVYVRSANKLSRQTALATRSSSYSWSCRWPANEQFIRSTRRRQTRLRKGCNVASTSPVLRLRSVVQSNWTWLMRFVVGARVPAGCALSSLQALPVHHMSALCGPNACALPPPVLPLSQFLVPFFKGN